MQIAHVRINNILGITELEFTPEGFTEISGPNGSGKTSTLEAIKAAIGQGHDATLLRKGETKGEVVLVLNDGTEIKKRIGEKSSPLEVIQDGKKVARPTDVIKALTDMLSVNPVDFLRARKADRVKVLLETMPLEADTAKLTEISGVPVHAEPGTHALAVIDAVRKQVYDDRTGTNRAVKEKDATLNQFRLAMPDAPAGVEGNEDELLGQVEAARTEKDAELDRIRAKLDGIKTDNHTSIDSIRAECQRQIDEIKTKALAEVEAIQAKERDIEGKANEQRERTNQRFNDAVAPINQAIEMIRADRSAAAKREATQETIAKMEEELEFLVKDAARQSDAIKEIDQYKLDLLSSLPIPGVEVIDGEVYRDGIAFDRLNTAQQVWIAVEIAKLRAGDLGICCVDGLELLDKAAFAEFRDRCLESGLQLFVSRVTDEEFAVNTYQ